MSQNEPLTFLCQWMTAPRRVGAIAPSGRTLAELITREIGPTHGPVIELGAGTGSFTHQLIARGVAESQLVLVELGDDFARSLSQRFPAAHVHRINAQRLHRLPTHASPLAGAVVSGLPLLSMSTLQVARILRGAFAHLRGDGAFYQFTYGISCPIPKAMLERFGLKAHYMGATLANLPPARVFRISRQSRVARGF
ncbi:class I SAM-dependent methyltransferase [Lysobacter sp. cf310]|uniref:class I SAM-dependent methyltransferase n=1 Tax=Lysobacter sp. cf310 TaxID=1761790 RepID=UPI0008F0B044|nr:SAM-dependent methyltransferase [Lysobacter sp. cf310]SFL21020.1 Phospholipid N-methyltransferase [Lysobacter sp. cf310]